MFQYISNFFYTFSQINEWYISGKCYRHTNENIQFTLLAPNAEICSAYTVANMHALSTLTVICLTLSLAANI